MSSDKLIDQFLENASNATAGVNRASDSDELNTKIGQLIAEYDAVFCPGLTDVEKVLQIPEEKRATEYASATATVEEVFGAIAETGSIVCSSEGGKALQAGLLPSHHIALVQSENIYSNLDDFFSSLSETPPTNITLITGPSRTADIELTLTVGVHGPERLDVIVI